MADTNRRIPLWLIALVGGVAVFSVAASSYMDHTLG